ncbi:MAG: hypothetical protein RL036_24 [Actinomycetota bacterium]|jgi:DNA (cytosine-5)-methyltransferase 1
MNNDQNLNFGYVDLFSGVGGFAAALNSLGGVVIAAAEIDERAAMAYERNFGHNPRGDVADLAKKSAGLQPFQVLTGGFPCQPFSKSGAQRGTSEARGTLFGEIETIVENTKPLIVILENVKNLTGPKHINEWNRIVAFFRSAGYRVSSRPAEYSPHLLDKSKGGRPQHRVRIFITATRNPGADGVNHETPEPVVTLSSGVAPSWDLAKDLPLDAQVPEKYNLSDQETTWLNAWDELLSHWRATKTSRFPGMPLWSDYWRDALPSDLSSYPDWKQKFVIRNHDFYLGDKRFIDSWLSKWSIRESFPASRRKFEWQAGDLASVWDCLIQFRPSGVRVKKPDYVPALVALNQTPIFGPLKRRITEREAARLQGFPANWAPASDQPAVTYKQMGNAVNIGVIAHVFREHCKRDRDVLEMDPAGRSILNALEIYSDNPDDTFTGWGGFVSRSQ